ncbi:MAG: 16S rRNA (adenine(1518)-N(6)/adenine(1519)-N(6))-dimethyltransferase RsmA [Actinomycetota bacterium]
MTLTRAHASDQLRDAGLSPRQALGQNFVVDANTVRRIAKLSGVGPGDNVIEIGAGLGSLTLALAETGANTTAVEVDEALVPLLTHNVAAYDNVRVVHADAMKLDWSSLLGEHTDWHLVANLPYNVATPLVADVLDMVPAVKHVFVMVQKEVGDRLVAKPNTDAYGALSVKVAFWATGSIAGIVPPTGFLPRPKVDSALVDIVRRDEPLDHDVDAASLFALVRQGFAKRRKMLRGALAGAVDPQQFEAAGIKPTARAENLSVHDWIRLCKVVNNAGERS